MAGYFNKGPSIKVNHNRQEREMDNNKGRYIVEDGKFTGEIAIRPERLDIPLSTRKPTVFAVWNELPWARYAEASDER
jgi:hypothetical protein